MLRRPVLCPVPRPAPPPLSPRLQARGTAVVRGRALRAGPTLCGPGRHCAGTGSPLAARCGAVPCLASPRLRPRRAPQARRRDLRGAVPLSALDVSAAQPWQRPVTLAGSMREGEELLSPRPRAMEAAAAR